MESNNNYTISGDQLFHARLDNYKENFRSLRKERGSIKAMGLYWITLGLYSELCFYLDEEDIPNYQSLFAKVEENFSSIGYNVSSSTKAFRELRSLFFELVRKAHQLGFMGHGGISNE